MTLYERLVGALRRVLRVFFRVRAIGLPEKLPEGGLIVCSNHSSNFDALFLAAALDRPITFMGKKSLLYVPIIRHIVRGVGMIPLSRDGGDAAKLRQAVRELKDGKLLVIFPQGRRFRKTPRGTPSHGGAGMMALLSGARIMPCAIVTRRYRVRPFCKVVLHFGEPKTYQVQGEGRSEKARAVSDAAFEDICSLAEEAEKML
ncbi:MAG: 1-acyl-sn-glycerol-3-phosphate acyltransferase [Clostridia bacterium]|nr:1-acyl-sn-glycerol-3-phosphate acyltransferase [Clostridia bacterium]